LHELKVGIRQKPFLVNSASVLSRLSDGCQRDLKDLESGDCCLAGEAFFLKGVKVWLIALYV
jgi:hypothetical protein